MKDHWIQAYKEFFYFGVFLAIVDIIIIGLYLFSNVFAEYNPTLVELLFGIVRMLTVTVGYLLVGRAFKSHKKWAIPTGYVLAALWFLPPWNLLAIIVGLYFIVRVWKAQSNPPQQAAPLVT